MWTKHEIPHTSFYSRVVTDENPLQRDLLRQIPCRLHPAGPNTASLFHKDSSNIEISLFWTPLKKILNLQERFHSTKLKFFVHYLLIFDSRGLMRYSSQGLISVCYFSVIMYMTNIPQPDWFNLNQTLSYSFFPEMSVRCALWSARGTWKLKLSWN